jgi:hypothetical protein
MGGFSVRFIFALSSSPVFADILKIGVFTVTIPVAAAIVAE